MDDFGVQFLALVCEAFEAVGGWLLSWWAVLWGESREDQKAE